MTKPATSQSVRRWLPQALILLVGLLSGLGLAWLLHRGLLEARAHSIDPTIYGRSLWGLAHGTGHNPMVERHALAVHGNFVLFILAPLNWFISSITILIAVQSISFSATVTMAGLAVLGQGSQLHTLHRTLRALGFMALLVFGSPLFLNPFIFDVRPDLIGVPLVTAGLLRALKVGKFDWISLSLMLPALLVREEFGLVLAVSFAITPASAAFSRSTRWCLAVGSVLYFIAYWGYIAIFSGKTAQVAQAALTAASDETPLQDLLLVKLHISMLIITSLGGVIWGGWRWLGVILPGLVGLLVNQHLPGIQLNTHYSLFLAPGLIVAAVAGLDNLSSRGFLNWRVYGATGAVATVCFVLASAAPGGGRFRNDLFLLFPIHSNAKEIHNSPISTTQRIHDALQERLPESSGVAAPYMYSPQLADRELILHEHLLLQMLDRQELPPENLEDVILLAPRWGTLGRALVAEHGFRWKGQVADVAFLTRRENVAPRWDELALKYPPAQRPPLVVWPDGGVALLHVWQDPARHVVVSLARLKPTSGDTSPPLDLVLRTSEDGILIPLLITQGLISIEHLPPGIIVTAISERPTRASGGNFILLRAHSEPLLSRVRDPGTSGGDGVRLNWDDHR